VVPLAAFGELGLTGELRHVAHAGGRMAEAGNLGLRAVIHPEEQTRTLRQALCSLDCVQRGARAA
jgi:predicted ATP-dependent serine protease